MLVKKLQVATVVVAGLLAAGSAVPVALKVTAQAPATHTAAGAKPTSVQLVQPAQAMTEDTKAAIGHEIEDTMHRLLAAMQAGDYQASCQEIWSEAPEERNPFKAVLRVSIAVDSLREVAAKLPKTGRAPWEGTVTMGQALEKMLVLPPGPRDTMEIQGDTVITRAYFDPVEVFGEEVGRTAEANQWVGVPNYYRRVGDRWVWDADRTFAVKATGLESDPADPHGQEKAMVSMLSAMADAFTQTAEAIRQGKCKTQAAAESTFGQAMGMRMGQMQATNVNINMVPAERK